MGVIVKKKPGDSAYWVFINHDGKRKAKRIGGRPPSTWRRKYERGWPTATRPSLHPRSALRRWPSMRATGLTSTRSWL